MYSAMIGVGLGIVFWGCGLLWVKFAVWRNFIWAVMDQEQKKKHAWDYNHPNNKREFLKTEVGNLTAALQCIFWPVIGGFLLIVSLIAIILYLAFLALNFFGSKVKETIAPIE